MIWRDDDVGVGTKLEALQAVDDILQRYRLPHTIAIVAQGLERRPDLVAFILERGIQPQLHCWNHDEPLTIEQARTRLPEAVALLARLFHRRPTVLYPPWNKSNAALELAAAALDLTVSTRKISLEQFIRCDGDVLEDVINFHHWHAPDVALLPEAARIGAQKAGTFMKVTDYCPRAAPFDTYLTGRGLVGVEVGVDVGAHAEALLRYTDVALLHLVDPWPREYQYGYCEGRLAAFRQRVRFMPTRSVVAAERFGLGALDFVYIDQVHEADSVMADLEAWWPRLKVGGLLGYRNYGDTATPLRDAVDRFIAVQGGDRIRIHVETGEIILVKA